MVAPLQTNYRMGSGLAAAIGGQESALDSERQTLANLGQLQQAQMNQPKVAEAEMMMQHPEFIQQKIAADLAGIRNKYDDAQMQTSLDKLTRAQIALQSSSNPQQTAMQLMQEAGIDPSSPQGQAILQDPLGTITKMRQGVATLLSQTPKQLGQESLEGVKGAWDMKKINAQIAGNKAVAGMQNQYRDQAQLAGMLKDATNNVNNIQNNLAKIESAEGKNALINQFVASGVPQAEAEAAVNSPEFKQQLQDQLRQARAEQEHLKKQSPYFKGFNFGSPAPTSTGSSSGLPPGVKLVNQ